MSWRQQAAARFPGSNVYHISAQVLIDIMAGESLCGRELWMAESMSIREARERGLRLCKKCAARADEVFARLLEVGDEVGPDVQ